VIRGAGNAPRPYAQAMDRVREDRDDLREAEVDPHWLALQGGSMLPSAYLPPMTGGAQAGWRKGAAWVLIVMITTTTAGGICLTYGPAELFRLISG